MLDNDKNKPELVTEEALIKVKFIEYLMKNHLSPRDIIINELPFGDGRRRADIATINSSIHVFEIKSKFDKLDTLSDQLVDYAKCFEKVSLVLATNHVAKSKKIAPRSIGIIEFTGKDFFVHRVAKQRVQLSKNWLVNIVSKREALNELKKMNFSVPNMHEMDAFQVRGILSKQIKLNDLKDRVRFILRKRYQENFDIFREEIGETVHIDDLALLSPSINFH